MARAPIRSDIVTDRTLGLSLCAHQISEGDPKDVRQRALQPLQLGAEDVVHPLTDSQAELTVETDQHL